MGHPVVKIYFKKLALYCQKNLTYLHSKVVISCISNQISETTLPDLPQIFIGNSVEIIENVLRIMFLITMILCVKLKRGSYGVTKSYLFRCLFAVLYLVISRRELAAPYIIATINIPYLRKNPPTSRYNQTAAQAPTTPPRHQLNSSEQNLNIGNIF